MHNFSKYTILAFSTISLLTIAEEATAQKRKLKEKDTVEVAVLSNVDTLIIPIPNNRYVFANKVTKAIRGADAKDGAVDHNIYSSDEQKSKVLTKAILEDAALLLIHIENSKATHNNKIRYENALSEIITNFNKKPDGKINPLFYKRVIENLEDFIIAIESGQGGNFVKNNLDIYTLENINVLEGESDAKAILFEKIGKDDPLMMIDRLPQFASEPYADKIVTAASRVAPGTLLTYATSSNNLSGVVRRNSDPLVQSIVKIADQSKSPFKVLPFLNQIHKGQKTVAEIDAISKNDDAYYKNLVQLLTSGEALNKADVDNEINYRSLKYIRKVNDLHEASDAVRFKGIEQFSAEELYFLLIGGQDEIYTSSYLGIFKRMLVKMDKTTGDQFLSKVKHEHFRTFIRMSAGYNTLDNFLKTMNETSKSNLMSFFVADLEKGSINDLTDAVDVADAFGSLKDKTLVGFLKSEVKNNYERVFKSDQKDNIKEKGIIIYGLLGAIFKNSDDANQLQNTVSNIPPINFVDYSSLVNAKGQVVQQVFFYGDEDGKISYESFMSSFKNNNWKIDNSNPNWVTITSATGKPVVIYANRPLTEPKDEEAQRALRNYMSTNEIQPSIVIHRGHSYHLDGSLENINPEVKVVMLGSCGGYHNLANVLDKSPDANIISSKQIGSFSVNEPIIREMNAFLVKGQNINWLEMWGTLDKYFIGKGKAQELFNDYVPPNKNLGAIFIKAYRKMELNAQI